MSDIMARIGPGKVRMRVHGRTENASEFLDAGVFARKLGMLVRGLKAADTALNGQITHDYGVEGLQQGSGDILLGETVRKRFRLTSPKSSVSGFKECVTALAEGHFGVARRYGLCASRIKALTEGTGKSWAYGELWAEDATPFRLDALLGDQAEAAVMNEETKQDKSSSKTWFKGKVSARLDGTIKAVDLRGTLPQMLLILSSGGQNIDCITRGISLDQIRSVLDHRVRVSGVAYYDGKSGLPRRMEVIEMKPIRLNPDLSRWAGTIPYFDVPDWIGSDV